MAAHGPEPGRSCPRHTDSPCSAPAATSSSSLPASRWTLYIAPFGVRQAPPQRPRPPLRVPERSRSRAAPQGLSSTRRSRARSPWRAAAPTTPASPSLLSTCLPRCDRLTSMQATAGRHLTAPRPRRQLPAAFAAYKAFGELGGTWSLSQYGACAAACNAPLDSRHRGLRPRQGASRPVCAAVDDSQAQDGAYNAPGACADAPAPHCTAPLGAADPLTPRSCPCPSGPAGPPSDAV